MELLKLKPEQTKVLLQQSFQTVEELQDLLDKAVTISNQHPSTIYLGVQYDSEYVGLDTQFTLEAEGLTDGSIVYNITVE